MLLTYCVIIIIGSVCFDEGGTGMSIYWVLHIISKIGAYCVLWAISYFAIKIVCKPFRLLTEKTIVQKVYIDDFIGIVGGVILVLIFCTVSSPYAGLL